MRYVRLGRSGLQVSAICLGTMNFGTYVPVPRAFRMLDRALDAGVNLIDTADVYGWGPNAGAVESTIGRYLAARKGARDRVLIATKLYREMEPLPNRGGLSAIHVRRACDASLRRLRTDHIDLYQFHHFDRNVPLEETWDACETLVRQGKVLYVGSSNFSGWQLSEAQAVARTRHRYGLASEQSVFNLLNRYAELEVLPACEHLGLGMLAWSPLSDGLLAGPPDAEGRRREPRNADRFESRRPELDDYFRLCARLGVSPSGLALAWLIRHPTVTAPIVGPRTVEQLDAALDALSLELGDEQWAELDQIFPGFRAAPEHYAW
jgi:aryl-alcohol dehydrogenase-like predicted oxidoreductase